MKEGSEGELTLFPSESPLSKFRKLVKEFGSSETGTFVVIVDLISELQAVHPNALNDYFEFLSNYRRSALKPIWLKKLD